MRQVKDTGKHFSMQHKFCYENPIGTVNALAVIPTFALRNPNALMSNGHILNNSQRMLILARGNNE